LSIAVVSWEEEDVVVFGMGGEGVVPGVYGEGGPLGHPHVQANNSRHLRGVFGIKCESLNSI